MKTNHKLNQVLPAGAIGVGMALLTVAAQPSPRERVDRPMAQVRGLPLELGSRTPLGIESAGVEWKGHTYHLVKLDTIQFDLDKPTGTLKARIEAQVNTFDKMNYDISATVFDADGELLGTARIQCDVERVWKGQSMMMFRSLNLDFGVSLDYARAKTFAVGVSKRTVLTPDEWQKTKSEKN